MQCLNDNPANYDCKQEAGVGTNKDALSFFEIIVLFFSLMRYEKNITDFTKLPEEHVKTHYRFLYNGKSILWVQMC